MYKMGYDIQKRPIFRLAKIPFPPPDDYPPGLPEELRYRFRRLVHQHLLLEDLWVFQLRDPADRDPHTLKAAYNFWRTHYRLLRSEEIIPFRRCTTGWLRFSMQATRGAIEELVEKAAKRRAKRKAKEDEAEAAEALTEMHAIVRIKRKRKWSPERVSGLEKGLQGEDEEEKEKEEKEEEEAKKRKFSPDRVKEDDVEDDAIDEARSLKMLTRIRDVADSDEPWVSFGTCSDYEEEMKRTPKPYRDSTGRKVLPEIDFDASSTDEEDERDSETRFEVLAVAPPVMPPN